MGFEEYLPYVIVAVGAVVVTALVMYAMMGKRRKDVEPTVLPKVSSGAATKWAFRAGRSVSSEEALKAREQLRILELEREILSDAIRRLYEAQAEGKITEHERDMLAEEYKAKMLRVKDAIGKNQSVVALQELETMQDDLVKLFDERFDELNLKIDELRSKVRVEPEREELEIPVEIEATEEEEETVEISEAGAEEKPARKKKPKPKTPPTEGKTEAEKRIDQIREEVEKVLDRLGQMEVET